MKATINQSRPKAGFLFEVSLTSQYKTTLPTNNQNMIFRNATITDINGVIELQGKNLLANIPENERVNGFVTTPFTVSQIESIVALDGLFVAEKDAKIIAYAFAGSWDYFSQWAIFPFMVNRLAQLNFRTEIMTTENSFQYGPICIEKNHRGSGVLQKLFEAMRLGMSKRYPIGVTFINQINKRSFAAHAKKLKMDVIDEFEFNGNKYYGLAFLTSESVLEKNS